jgi:hypothetical protein
LASCPLDGTAKISGVLTWKPPKKWNLIWWFNGTFIVI